MSYDKTYNKYSSLISDLKIEIRRIDSNGNYEGSWKDIETLTHDWIRYIVHRRRILAHDDAFSICPVTCPDIVLDKVVDGFAAELTGLLNNVLSQCDEKAGAVVGQTGC